jgi:AraC-like DNA-binding protein
MVIGTPTVENGKLTAKVSNITAKQMTEAVDYVFTADVRNPGGTIEKLTLGEGSISVASYMKALYHATTDIGIRDLARHTGYHEKYISSTLHALTGLNFRSFLATYRINYARHLLRTTDRRIADIAHLCGFSSINTFNRTFLRQLGATPSQYRKK